MKYLAIALTLIATTCLAVDTSTRGTVRDGVTYEAKLKAAGIKGLTSQR